MFHPSTYVFFQILWKSRSYILVTFSSHLKNYVSNWDFDMQSWIVDFFTCFTWEKRHKTTFNCILNMQNLFLEFPVWTPYLNFWFPSSYPHISSRVEDSLLFLKYTWNNSRAVTSGGIVTRVSGTRSNIGNWKKSLLLCIYTKNLAKQLKNSLSISFCQIFAVHTYIFNDIS